MTASSDSESSGSHLRPKNHQIEMSEELQMVTYKPNGGAEWIKLEKPTTQPVITRAK